MAQELSTRLGAVPLFRGIDPAGLETLAGAARGEVLGRSGAVLCQKGDLSDSAWIVTRGTLVAELPLPDGTCVELARMGPGSVVGELCLIREGPRALRVKAIEHTELIVIDRAAFAALRSRHDPAAYRLIRNICVTMCDRLRTTTDFIEGELRQETREAPTVTAAGSEGAAGRARRYLAGLFGREGA